MSQELCRIGTVASRWGISSRTLRYYEEAGLIHSTRSGETQSRLYDGEALERLKQILMLKQAGLSIEEIRGVFVSREAAIHVCSRKLQQLKESVGTLERERRLLESLLERLHQDGYSLREGLEEIRPWLVPYAHTRMAEVRSNHEEEDTAVKQLTREEVRIVTLNPMRVACYNAISTNPEEDAFNHLMAWVKKMGIDQRPHTRYFGYDTSKPSDSSPVYGYALCVTIDEDILPEAPITVKTLPGGLYAVSSLYGYDIPVAWHRLMAWLEESPYEAEWPSRQCLEEHFPNDRSLLAEDIFQLDLYEPIKKRI